MNALKGWEMSLNLTNLTFVISRTKKQYQHCFSYNPISTAKIYLSSSVLHEWNIFSYPPHDGDGLEGEEPRVPDLVVDDAVEHLLFVVARKRRLADQHLEDEDAEAPPVDRARVRRLRQDFRGQKFRRSAEGSGSVAEAHALFAEPEVSDLDVALGVEQQVVEFQVSERL